MKGKRIMAIDVGTVRCGIAISDPTLTIATIRPPILVKDGKDIIQKIIACAKENDVGLILVGNPISMDGLKGKRAQAVERFAKSIEGMGIEVKLVDERLSTVEAQKRLFESGKKRKKGYIDSASAGVILQAYLDLHKDHNQ